MNLAPIKIDRQVQLTLPHVEQQVMRPEDITRVSQLTTEQLEEALSERD